MIPTKTYRRKGEAPIECAYLGEPGIETRYDLLYRCNAVYSAAPDPQAGKPCRTGQACWDKFNNLCRVPNAKRDQP